MDRVEVEAVEDRSRADGGHAVILLRGVMGAPTELRFRLRLVEADGLAPDTAGVLGVDLKPDAISATGDGLALTIGPAIACSPALIPGAAIEITLPDIRVSGEFLWPAVSPQARPKR